MHSSSIIYSAIQFKHNEVNMGGYKKEKIFYRCILNLILYELYTAFHFSIINPLFVQISVHCLPDNKFVIWNSLQCELDWQISNYFLLQFLYSPKNLMNAVKNLRIHPYSTCISSHRRIQEKSWFPYRHRSKAQDLLEPFSVSLSRFQNNFVCAVAFK